MKTPQAICAVLLPAMSVSFAVLADPPKEVMNIWRSEEVKFVPSPIVPGAANAEIGRAHV